MNATIEGRIVKKVENESRATNIKLELVNYQTVDLVYDSSSDGELPDAQEWVRVQYDDQTSIIVNIEHIQKPTLQQVAKQRKHFVYRRPFTTVFSAIAAFSGASVWYFQWDNIPVALILMVPFLLFTVLALIAGKYE